HFRRLQDRSDPAADLYPLSQRPDPGSALRRFRPARRRADRQGPCAGEVIGRVRRPASIMTKLRKPLSAFTNSKPSSPFKKRPDFRPWLDYDPNGAPSTAFVRTLPI